MDRVARRGPLARAPGALEKKNLEKKISQCRKKLKGVPFGIFQHLFCRKTAKKIEGGILWEKNY